MGTRCRRAAKRGDGRTSMTRATFDSHASRSGKKYLSVSPPCTASAAAALCSATPSISLSMSAPSAPSPSDVAPSASVNLPKHAHRRCQCSKLAYQQNPEGPGGPRAPLGRLSSRQRAWRERGRVIWWGKHVGAILLELLCGGRAQRAGGSASTGCVALMGRWAHRSLPGTRHAAVCASLVPPGGSCAELWR